MASVAECWALYAREHLPATVQGRQNYRYWGRIKWFANHDAEKDLSPKEVERYVAMRRSKGLKDGTINREIIGLRACLRHAERAGLIEKAPIVKGLRAPPPKMRVLTKEEATAMVQAADSRLKWREIVYIRLALGTGQRPGAIVELKWSQVDLTNMVIDFRSPDPKYALMKKRAIVPINPMVMYALELAQKNRRGDHVIQLDGRRLGHPRKLVAKIAAAAGLVDVSPHVLRHTVASLLLQDGVDLLRVSRLLGHANTMITQTVYFQHPPSWLKDTTNLLKF